MIRRWRNAATGSYTSATARLRIRGFSAFSFRVDAGWARAAEMSLELPDERPEIFCAMKPSDDTMVLDKPAVKPAVDTKGRESATKKMRIYVDGKFFGEDDAKISVFDHGLLYGDGIFEGIRFSN